MECKQDVCNGNIEKCNTIKRIAKVLKESDINQDKFDLKNIIDDFHHIQTIHCSDEQLETLHFILDIKCNPDKCKSLQRNYRDRMTEDTDNNIVMEIIDQIHCYLLHSFDFGMKLTSKEKNQIHQENGNLSFDRINNILTHKKKRFNRLNRVKETENHSKFVTQYTDTIDEKLSDITARKDNDTYPTYSFSYHFNYWNNNKLSICGNIIVTHKYESFKQELLSNKICATTIKQWNKTLNKSKVFITCEYAKFLPSSQQKLSLTNLMSIIFYCDYTILSQKFSETFRKMNCTETLKEVVSRHKNYFWFSKTLRETIETFGDTFDENSKQKYFHGISCAMIFNSTIARFYHPVSTTTQLIVASQFAGYSGIIIEIGGFKASLCFHCTWISSFSNEQETLFMASNAVKIENIIECSNGQEFRKYLSALTHFIRSVTGHHAIGITKTDVSALNLLLKQHDSVPSYFQNIFKATCESIKEMKISMGMNSVFTFDRVTKYFIKMFCNEPFVNLKFISKLFYNVERISFVYGYHSVHSIQGKKINLSAAYFDCVIKEFIANDIPYRLKDIAIRNVQIMNEFKDVSHLIQTIGGKFKQQTTFALVFDDGYDSIILKRA
eukprot:354414_1